MASIPVQKAITSRERRRTDRPQAAIYSDLHSDVYISDILLQLDARFSAYGAIEIKNDGATLFRQDDLGAFRQYQNFRVGTLNTILRESKALEIWVWNPHTAEPVAISVNLTYSEDEIQPGPLGAPRAIGDLNQELSENVGGLDPPTKALLEELAKIQANIGARRIRVDEAELTARINKAITAIQDPKPNLESIRAHITEIFDLIGGQALANDIEGITAQLEGLLQAINNNEIEIETKNLEDLLDDIKDKTVPDDLGISDGIAIVDQAPIPAAAQPAAEAIKAALVGLRDGFDLQELNRAISTLEDQIPDFEAGAPDDTLTDQFKLILMRLKRQSETLPDPAKADSSALFPNTLYEPGTHTNVIDTRGYTHFIASMAPHVIDGTGFDVIQGADVGDIYGDQTGEVSKVRIFDLRDSHTKKILCIQPQFFGLGYSGGRPNYTGRETVHSIKIESSPTPDFENPTRIFQKAGKKLIYNMKWERTGGTSIQIARDSARLEPVGFWFSRFGARSYNTITAPAVELNEFTDRYVRITHTTELVRAGQDPYPSDAQTSLKPLVEDRAETPGVAALSFEFQDNFGRWYPAIPASEIGTLLAGGDPLVVRFSEARYGFPLPASATLFRARLDISGGRIGLGVALLLLS